MKKSNFNFTGVKPWPLIFIFLISLMVITLSSCYTSDINKSADEKISEIEDEAAPTSEADERQAAGDEGTDNSSGKAQTPEAISTFSFISEEGTTLKSRINPPEGYVRVPAKKDELSGFLRNMSLTPKESKLLYYDGSIKPNQEDHVAIFDVDTGDRDLQQCADSIIRIYAEYYWSIGAYDKIAFHLTNGFLMEYTKWRDGNRLVVNGNDVSWKLSTEYDDSYEAFRKYLDMVFAYAGTLSLSTESKNISADQLKVGDMFLQGGSPGHCVLVVDLAEDENGKRCFLLAQGYMPAQQFHVIKNPLHPEDPWYYVSELAYPLATPAWTFQEDSLVRWADFPMAEDGSDTTIGSLGSTSLAGKPNSAIPAMGESLQTASGEDRQQVTLLAVGDNLIHTQVVSSGKKEDGTYNYDHLYDNVKEDISAADIAVINQETIFGDKKNYSGYPNFNSPSEIGDAAVAAGFDVVLHATNHTLDMGKSGVLHTFSFWKKYPEITVLGINESKDQQDTIPVIEKNGIKVAMLNYTYGLNGYKLPKDMPYLVNMLDKKLMASHIEKAKELADFIIVFPHWGTEYVYEATKYQKDLTEFFYEQGVDVVIGTHPHVIEPVEWFELGDGHRMLVYYSLGNFMSYQKEAPRMLGAMANITIVKDKNGTYISEAGITPIVTHFENGFADYNYDIYKLTDYSAELASLHGVSELALQGAFTYETTLDLAKKVLGNWFIVR